MVQIDFRASTAEQALHTEPYQIDLSQHGGGEQAAWTSGTMKKDGTHPRVYVATGSHANYFGNALYLGRSASAGFGCDDTRQATEAVRAQAVILPDIPSSATSPFAWLAFRGRWDRRSRASTTVPRARP
ncbi:MAG TPA: hypothetical protein VEF89_20030 [Solirubrobacteraceae bacterium]|nr:hypothetical protein [Solirubrobacteraceae bacterium]